MSEPVARRRPMIDLDEFERRLRQPSAASRTSDGDPLAELARLVGGNDDPYRAVFGTRNQDQAQGPLAAPPRQQGAEHAGAEPRRAGHDHFDELETGLLGTRHQPARRPDEEADLGAVDRDFSHWAAESDTETPYPAEETGDEPRSRRPLYLMAAIIVVGMIGIGASFVFKSGGSGPSELATIRAPEGPTKVAVEAQGEQGAVRDASVLDKAAQTQAAAVVDTREQPVDLSQIQDRPPRVIGLGGAKSEGEPGKAASGAASVPVPVPPAQVVPQRPQEPSGIAALIEPKKVKTVAVRPDGTLVQTPPSPPQAADVPLPAPRPAKPVAKAATPKVAERVMTTPKPAADAGGAQAPIAPPQAAQPPVAPSQQATAGGPATAAPAKGSYAVQLAAPETEQEAREIQVRLMKKHGGELSGFHPSIRKASVGDKTVYRVRVVNLSREEAVALCQKIQSGGSACFVAKN